MESKGLAKIINDFMSKHLGMLWSVVSNILSGFIISLLFTYVTYLANQFTSFLGYKGDAIDHIYNNISKIGTIIIISIFTIAGIVILGIECYGRVVKVATKVQAEVNKTKNYYEGDLDVLPEKPASIILEKDKEVSKADDIDLIYDAEDM